MKEVSAIRYASNAGGRDVSGNVFRSFSEWLDVHADRQLMLAASNKNACQRRYVAVIPAPCQRDVILRTNSVVGGIQVHPLSAAKIDGQPCMGSIGADKARLPDRRNCSQVATDVTAGNPMRSEHCDLKVSKILTNTAAQTKDVGHGSIDSCRAVIVDKVSVDPLCQLNHILQQRTERRQ